MSIYLILLITIVKKITSFKYLKLTFQRNLNGLTNDNIMEKLFNNDIYTKIKIGSKSEEIPLSFKTNTYPFYLISSDIESSEVKLFDYKKSDTYKIISDKETTFENIEFTEAKQSSDKLKLSQSEFQNLEDFKFMHAIKLNEKFIINEAGTIGLLIQSDNIKYEEFNFISQLKKRHLIDESIYSFQYTDIKKEKGEFIVGVKLDEIDKKKYNSSNYRSIVVDPDLYILSWRIKIEKIYFDNKIYINYDDYIYFQIEKGVIIASKELQAIIKKKNFFEANSCDLNTFQIKELQEIYNYYICSDTIDIQSFGNLTFHINKTERDYMNFTLNHEDLFYKFNQRYYFLIVFPNKLNNEIILGTPFLKKYDIIFNMEQGRIGFYTEINKSTVFTLTHLIIIILFLIIIGLVLFIYFSLCKKKRKLRVNEIEDDFDYIPHRQQLKAQEKLISI